MNQFIICQGFAKTGMYSVILGAVLNIILDPIFIFGLHMGVSGAAVATVISQMASCAFVLRTLFGKNMPVQHHLRRLQLAADPQSAHHRLYPVYHHRHG